VQLELDGAVAGRGAEVFHLLDGDAGVLVAVVPLPRCSQRRSQLDERWQPEAARGDPRSVEGDGCAQLEHGCSPQRDGAAHAEADDPAAVRVDAGVVEHPERGAEVVRQAVGIERHEVRCHLVELVVAEHR
jgi:hypothetical protein